MPNKTRPSHFHDIKTDRFRIADCTLRTSRATGVIVPEMFVSDSGSSEKKVLLQFDQRLVGVDPEPAIDRCDVAERPVTLGCRPKERP